MLGSSAFDVLLHFKFADTLNTPPPQLSQSGMEALMPKMSMNPFCEIALEVGTAVAPARAISRPEPARVSWIFMLGGGWVGSVGEGWQEFGVPRRYFVVLSYTPTCHMPVPWPIRG